MDNEDSELVSVSEFSQEEDHSSHNDLGSDIGNGQPKPKKKFDEIGQQESKSVFRAKAMVYLVLILSCVAASILTYFFTSDQEEHDFENDFDVFALKIVRASTDTLSSKFEVAQNLGITTSSFANDRGDDFPYVAVADFGIRTQKVREMSGAELVIFFPLVPKEDHILWQDWAQNNSGWIKEGLAIQNLSHVDPGPVPYAIHTPAFELEHHHEHEDSSHEEEESAEHSESGLAEKYFAVSWQSGRAPINASIVNSNFLDDETFRDLAGEVVKSRSGFISKIVPLPLLGFFDHSSEGNEHAEDPHEDSDDSSHVGVDVEHDPTDKHDPRRNPHSYLLDPVYENPEGTGAVVGFYYLVVPWDIAFENILPQDTGTVEVVLNDSCGSVYTYSVKGAKSTLKGPGDLHDSEYNKVKKTSTITSSPTSSQSGHETCAYVLEIYPTDDLRDTYHTNDPVIFAVVVAMIFVFTTMVFLVYDWAVQRRQWMIIRAARKTQAIVSSLFPKNVQERIMKDVDDEVNREVNKPLIMRGNRTKDQLQNFLKGKDSADDNADMSGPKRSKPIADLFPEATIIFADIVGFTAWSSTREPSQVFQLLETIYHVFDEIASRRRVFKVETVGDCYVAVAGLPEPRKDHAIVMARFARDCLVQFTATVKAMVVELGPDTEELGVRIGLHSGPVTAGVLRGERARFQLFGDTVNTTARMESTGQPNKIHVSQETADLLAAAGKSQWLRTRREKVVAKGKGELQTYWLDASGEAGTSTGSGESVGDVVTDLGEDDNKVAPVVAPTPVVPSADKYNRLVAWNCDILAKLLTQIVAHRESRRTEPDAVSEIRKLEEQYGSNRYVLSEVQEIVRLPKYEADSQRVDPWSVQLSDEVLGQLKDYVQTLAAMYRDNPFHNFEHASHVTMSVMKLLSRIVAPDMSSAPTDSEEALHDHTYGITSDPMTQFAVALSALIHDVDHPGVPNSQLIKEQTSLAAVYRNKSIAEQNSVDLAWDLLMDDAYSDLRRAIYVTKAEFMRFRQLVVNIVLATDIMDKDLGALRKGRWNKAFSGETSGSSEDDVNRKATIVMEHLIQASDVAHTMQHWHIYRKWNQRLFKELYEAYLQGRAEKDPSVNWYEGEKGFFDFYIIPLAKKLKDCGVFGVSSDEYLQYAVQNRKEWELKGSELVAEMLQSFRDQGMVPKATSAEDKASEAEQAPKTATEQAPEQAPAKPKSSRSLR